MFLNSQLASIWQIANSDLHVKALYAHAEGGPHGVVIAVTAFRLMVLSSFRFTD